MCIISKPAFEGAILGVHTAERADSLGWLLKDTCCDCKWQNYISTYTVYIKYTSEKIQFSDLHSPSSCHFAFFLCRTDGLVVIGHRWGFRGNIKHPTQCYICPSFDSTAEMISKRYRLLLSYVCVSAAQGLRQAKEHRHEVILLRRQTAEHEKSLALLTCSHASMWDPFRYRCLSLLYVYWRGSAGLHQSLAEVSWELFCETSAMGGAHLITSVTSSMGLYTHICVSTWCTCFVLIRTKAATFSCILKSWHSDLRMCQDKRHLAVKS